MFIYIKQFSDYYNTDKRLIFSSDFILHILPLIFIINNHKYLLQNFYGKSNRLYSLFISWIIVIIYLKIIKSPQKYYPVPLFEMYILPILIYIIISIIIPKKK